MLPSCPAFTNKCILFGSTKEYSLGEAFNVDLFEDLLITSCSDIYFVDAKFSSGYSIEFLRVLGSLAKKSFVAESAVCTTGRIKLFLDIFPINSTNSTYKNFN